MYDPTPSKEMNAQAKQARVERIARFLKEAEKNAEKTTKTKTSAKGAGSK